MDDSWLVAREPMMGGDGESMRVIAALALGKATSPDFVGYWQRHKAA